jgi:hypothetical protein
LWANSSFFATFLVFAAELGKVSTQANPFSFLVDIKIGLTVILILIKQWVK